MSNIILKKGDCLELLKDIPDNSVDLILTDPPYGTIQGLNKLNGSSYKNVGIKWDLIIDINIMFKEINRVLRPNGRCILFSQEPYTFKLISEIKNHPTLKYNQKAIWLKNNAANILGCKRSLVNYYEEINIISKINYDYNLSNPLIEYFKEIKKYTKLTRNKWFEKYNNHNIAHSIEFNKQFNLCTEETYNILIKDYNIRNMKGFKEYKELKENNNINKKVFNLNGLKSKKNVFEYKKPSKAIHPTQKPVDLLSDLIKTYSNENDIVLDFTMGSGSTGIACIETNRKFIGFELDDNYFNIALNRIENKLKENTQKNL